MDEVLQPKAEEGPVLPGQAGRSTGQSEHDGGFQDTTTPQMGLEAITAVLAGRK